MGSLQCSTPGSRMFKYADDIVVVIPVEKSLNANELIMNKDKTRNMTRNKTRNMTRLGTGCRDNGVAVPFFPRSIFPPGKINLV